jgi:3-keto-disaccharide hydrolase
MTESNECIAIDQDEEDMEKRVRALILGAAASLAFLGWPISHRSADGDVQTLFNGKDLTGWDGDHNIWSVQAGAITGQTTEQNRLKENAFLVWQGGTPANFELRVSFRLVAKNDKNFANSGIYYRSRVDAASKQVLGYQGDMDASLPDYLGALYEDDRGTIAKSGQRVRVFRSDGKPKIEILGQTAGAIEIGGLFAELGAGHWLHYVIIAEDNHLRHYVNGKLTVDVTDEDHTKPKSGIIALQVHHGAAMLVQFKDIQIKPLPSTMSAPSVPTTNTTTSQ